MHMAARLPYLDREQVPPDVQAVYDKMKKATGRVLNTFRLMAHHAHSVAPVVAWYGTLREGALDLKLRQLAYVKASQINGCNY
jgi:alkylhydroperoxidase family enzyme